MGSTVAKVLLPGIGGKIFKDKKKAPAAAAPAAPKGRPVDRAKEARRGMLGRGAEDRDLKLGARDQLGARAESLGVPSSAEIQGNRRFKREGVQGASRRLLS